MTISATIRNQRNVNDVIVATEGNNKHLVIPGRDTGYGSSVNGGELLFLSLATCFCNDVYREAGKQNLSVSSVEVTVTGQFTGEGHAASNISYSVQVKSDTMTQQEIDALISHVDKVAEVHNTLRQGIAVSLMKP